MGKLEELDGDQLHAALEEATSAKSAKRLVGALAYKDGVDAGVLYARYGIPSRPSTGSTDSRSGGSRES